MFQNIITLPDPEICEGQIEALGYDFYADANNADKSGTYLDDYHGLWHLGLDMLPSPNSESSNSTLPEITYLDSCRWIQNEPRVRITVGNMFLRC